MKDSVTIRFYEELNDFLPKGKRKTRFNAAFSEGQSVKDFIQAFGVPHTEVDLILVNGKSVDFNYLLNTGDDISVYPVFESLDVSKVQRLRPKPLRKPKFVLDVHLGKLAKLMRLFGFDTHYEKHYDDNEIIEISKTEKRAILTRDVGLLKRNEVTHDYFVRNIHAEEQLLEIIERFDLRNEINEFSRCLVCNGLLEDVEKEKVLDKLPPKVKALYEDFKICPNCGRVYWQGTHYEKMKKFVMKFKETVK